MISHSAFFARCSSVSGSTKSATLTDRASSICAFVLLTINTGLPRHFTIKRCPGSMGSKSTSVVDAARVSAAGFIWSTSGQTAAATPKAPKVPVASIKKSRLVSPSTALSVLSSARSAEVTILSLSIVSAYRLRSLFDTLYN